MFGRDEEALQQLGTELGGGGGDGGSLSDFLASYRQGAAAAAEDGSDEEDEERQQRGGAGGLVLFEDRGGAEQQQAAARRRRQAVWEDPQDAALRVNVAAKSQLRKLRREEEETELTGERAAADMECAAVWGARWRCARDAAWLLGSAACTQHAARCR